MGKTLDIDLYKDGFDYRYIDCIQGPLAASTGYFKYDNYYYYCFLHSLWGNIEITLGRIYPTTPIKYCIILGWNLTK